MNGKKISGIILMLIGAALIVFSCIISGKVKQGEVKIQRSQNTVNTIHRFSDTNPNTKPIGRIATRPVQKKIDQGRKKASTYKGVSIWGLVGGIILAAVGLILFILGFFNPSKQKKRKTAKTRKK